MALASSIPPNLDFGSKTIVFDTHPQEQSNTYISAFWSALKQNLHTAMTGIVPPYLPHGTIRLQWETVDGNVGRKDYMLHEYVLVKQNFDLLCSMRGDEEGAAYGGGYGDRKIGRAEIEGEEAEGEIRRVMVICWSGQNPYVHEAEGRRIARGWAAGYNGPSSGSVDKKGRELSSYEDMKRRKERALKQKEVFDREEEGREGKVVDIEKVLGEHERLEEARRKEEVERLRKELEGKDSGSLV